MIIKNRRELLSKGNIRGRKIALDIIDHTMQAIDAYGLTRKLVSLEGNLLKIDSLTFDLAHRNNIYVLGAGKAVLQIAEALEDVLGDRITKGVIIEKKLNGMTRGLERIKKLKRIKVLQGDHPVPDEVDVSGAKEMLEIAKSAGEGDLVFFCVQGGCTCQTTLPVEGLNLEEVRETTDVLLKSGANVEEVNVVRAAITLLSDGRLAQYVHPAEIINIVVNDGVWGFAQGWRLESCALGWGPCVPAPDLGQDELSFMNSTLKKYSSRKQIPGAVRNHLKLADTKASLQTVEDFKKSGIKYHSFVLADPETGAEAAYKDAKQMGLSSMILSTTIEGEASQVGIVLASFAKEIVKNRRPLKPPCALIAAGETTVTVVGGHGLGGRNQEAALSAALKIDGGQDIVIVSIGTDGTDGPTPIAGGIVDGDTVQRSREKGIDLVANLKKHNSSHVLAALGDAIYFNEPGNNVCDLALIIVTD